MIEHTGYENLKMLIKDVLLYFDWCLTSPNYQYKKCMDTNTNVSKENLDVDSTAVKRLGQFFVLFHEISFTIKWKHEQGYIWNVFPFPSHKRVSLALNAPHPDKIALTNGVDKSEFAHFQTLRTFVVKFEKS